VDVLSFSLSTYICVCVCLYIYIYIYIYISTTSKINQELRYVVAENAFSKLQLDNAILTNNKRRRESNPGHATRSKFASLAETRNFTAGMQLTTVFQLRPRLWNISHKEDATRQRATENLFRKADSKYKNVKTYSVSNSNCYNTSCNSAVSFMNIEIYLRNLKRD